MQQPSRGVLFAVLVVTAVVAQVTVVDRVPLPRGHPDLLLVLVVACALVAGSLTGMITGFCAGLLADIVPPADHTVGRLALAYALVGYAAGLLEDVEERSVALSVITVGLASAGATALYALVGALVGDHRVTVGSLVRVLPAVVLYDVVLTPFVVPLVAALTRRLEPEPSRR